MRWPQFTLKSLAQSIALICFGLVCATLCYEVATVKMFGRWRNLVFLASFTSAGALFGAAIGVLFDRKLIWAMIGAAIVLVAGSLTFQAILFGCAV